ncbi:ATP-dependent DNA helicase [Candidatus Woesearchaeota archaeon]|nr:ATP-dependent DNA helicase [Candidatus Woesearchaeota archaeon]
MEQKLKDLFFPHETVREVQNKLIQEIDNCIKNKQNLIVHAPTGLGKTAATLPIALSHAIKNNLTVFFLTSRHTQHKIAIDTLKKIKQVHKINFTAIDLIGKIHMCPVPGIDSLHSYDFAEYCKNRREEKKCEFYNNIKSKGKEQQLSKKTEKVLKKLKKELSSDVEEVIKICTEEKLCPYEISMLLAKEASVIICDYYHLFSPSIRQTFFQRTNKELEDSIIIIDEGHNLPKRIIDLLTQKVSTINLSRAVNESRKFGFHEVADQLKAIKEILEQLAPEERDEKLVKKDEFANKIKLVDDYENIVGALEFAAEDIRQKQNKSYLGSIAQFLIAWQGEDKAYARILSKIFSRNETIISLAYKCLDPSLRTKDIVNKTHSTIIMSGTLTPTSMYQDILGFDKNKTIEKEYPSPFPSKNKLNLIVPETTTKFTKRSPDEYKKIAKITAKIINLTPGNSAVFFPSYRLRDDVFMYLDPLCKKTTFLEKQNMNKSEKQELLERFKSYKEIGATLLAVASANFAEGIDLPNILKSVVVVGLPLQKPNLETTRLIDYYDQKFGRGWDYGYIFPAVTKCLQSAGRCIRSETDRGVIIFLDERFAWQNYLKCFPPDSDIKITKLYEDRINEFFS